MSADQDHHYLPQSYQAGWAVSGVVRVFQWRYNKLDVRRKSTAATGSRPGLYYIPMAPSEERNFMEDVFWKKIDQDGADGLALLRSNDPATANKLDKDALATFVMSLEFRNPRRIAEIEAHAKARVLSGCLREDYAQHRKPYEPATFEEFKAALNQPGLTELGAELLRTAIMLPAVRAELLKMEWHVVELTNSVPVLTSDVPLIRHKGLVDDDGMIILPLSPKEFFVAYNLGKIDMRAWIDASIRDRTFVEGINRYVIGQKIDYVYADDDSQRDFIEAHW
jgi:hypothetical protein